MFANEKKKIEKYIQIVTTSFTTTAVWHDDFKIWPVGFD